MKVIAARYSLKRKIVVAKIVVIYAVLGLLIYLTSSLEMIATINKSTTLTIFNLFDLVFLEFFRVLGVAQGVKSTTRVLLLLRIFLHATLVLNEGNCKEFNSQNGGKGTPWYWVSQVCGLASWNCSPLLSLHPVPQSQRLWY